jgi:diketogulonate reductase-like aldo/keto reductase
MYDWPSGSRVVGRPLPPTGHADYHTHPWYQYVVFHHNQLCARFMLIKSAESVDHVRENAVVIDLSEAEMERIDAIISSHVVVGDRYPSYGMVLTDL